MPLYVYKCNNCGESFEESHSIANRKTPTETECDHCNKKELFISLQPLQVSDPISLGRVKPSDSFRTHLQEMKDAHPGNNINII